MKYKYAGLALTGIIIGSGIINVAAGKGLKLGVDFGGGTLIRVMLKNPVPVSEVRQSLKDVGLGNSVIQETGKMRHEYMIRTMQVIRTKDQQQELEAHEKLGDRVIDALKGNEGKAELEKGLKDLNDIDEPSLTSLLGLSSPDKASEIAQKIISFRVSRGIIEDFSQLQSEGISPEVISFLKEKTFLGKLTVLSRETVGPQVGHDLRRKATQATIWALIGMLIYIAVRFKLAYGVSAILTLTQDVLITMSIYSFTNREINLPIIAAILTIVGFSINDTIVIFDRVRENLKSMKKTPLEDILNISLNQCLGRTLITTGTVFLTLLALFLFGGGVINDFAFAMLVGSIEGVYSTVYISCPVVYFWQKTFKPKRGFRK